MTEIERNMWKRAYSLHERYHDMPLTAEGFSMLTDALGQASKEFDDHPLMQGLLMAILDYQDARFHQREEKP